MVMHETGGVDLLLNGLDDGGAGICHMQPKIANQFGLKIYQNNKKLVSKTHGKRLRNLVSKNKFDRKKLIAYDDRFHPVLNLDAVGRMLHCYQKRKVRGLTRTQSGIYRYAGSYNYRKYWRNVNYYMKRLNDKNELYRLEKRFNKLNRNLRINGSKAGFKGYIAAHQKQNRNYGLDNYK